jgi:serine/threonine protein kinase
MTEGLLAFQSGVCQEPRSEEPTAEADAAPVARPWDALIHGDIKLENIFCCDMNTSYPSYPRVVLADFELAESLRRLRHRHVGTVGWQPPVSFDVAVDL